MTVSRPLLGALRPWAKLFRSVLNGLRARHPSGSFIQIGCGTMYGTMNHLILYNKASMSLAMQA